ncbi:MAG: serine/threonine-protein kinase [Gammaproteobacteria bacterium]
MDKTLRTDTIKSLHEEALATALANTGDSVCPRCKTAYDRVKLTPPEYKCVCGLELAYPEMGANGEVKGVLGWLHSPGVIVHDRYRIVQLLGRGGFGSTYLVEDMKLGNKRRALKEVPEPMYDEHETRILAKLNHPSVPDITDRAVGDGMVYLVLEFGGSRTLETVRRSYPEKRVPLAQLAPWVRQLCDVLAYMHAQQPPIVHRDLKPGNILLDDQDRVMLIDFGIAKEAVASEQTRALGRAVTHGYSPPEQAMGTGTDARSDVYALGATIYYMLTGQRPPGAAERIQGAEVTPASRFVGGLPPAVDRALLQALSLNPNERQQNVHEFGKAFDYDVPTVKTYDLSERTVVIGGASTPSVNTGPQMSLKLTPDGPQVVTPPPKAVNRGIGRVAVVASVVGLLVAAGAVAYVISQFGKSASETVTTEAPAQPDPAPAPVAVTPPPAPAPVVPAPVAATPAETASAAPSAPPPVTPAEPPAAPVPPPANVATAPPTYAPPPAPASVEPAMTAPAAPPPAPSGSSAMEELLKRRQASETAAEPDPPATTTTATAEPAPKPVKRKQQKPQPVEPAPAPAPDPAPVAGGAANAWQKANQNTQFIEGN